MLSFTARRFFSSLAPVKGMKDLLGNDAWRFSKILSIMSEQSELYGLERIEIPIVEKEELFARGVGEDSDIVSKEMYTFTDKSNRKLCLRPEFTSSVLRAILNDKEHANSTQSVYYFGSAYRYERPQHGRYREFHQFGGEIINYSDPNSIVDIISLCHSIINKINISSQVTLEINCLGSLEDMAKYRSVLKTYFSSHETELSQESQNRLNRGSILRILDSKEKEDKEIINQAPTIIDYLSDESTKRFDSLQQSLTILGIPYTLNPHLVRGLDYYDNVVFEFASEAGAVMGGGCYSSLAKSIGINKTIPCIGFSAGIERCLLLSSLQPSTDKKGVGIVLLGEDENRDIKKAGLCLTQLLRNSNIKSIYCNGNGNMKKAMKDVVKHNLRYAVIIGTNELALYNQEKIHIKDMTTHDQCDMNINEFINLVKVYNCLFYKDRINFGIPN